MDRQTDARMDQPKAICPFNFSKVGGIKNMCKLLFDDESISENSKLYHNKFWIDTRTDGRA